MRSVIWNYELPWLLISGGDDSTFCLWDIRSNSLLHELEEKCIAIAGLTTHPKKPFTLVSSHFDNSVTFWDLLGLSDIYHVEVKFCFDMSLLDTVCDAHD